VYIRVHKTEEAMPAHGYDDWKATDPAAAELGPEYECHYCGCYGDHEEKLTPSQYDGGLDTILVCERPICQGLYAHELNISGLAVVVEKMK
jgi:hypothetical protein